MTGYRRSTPPGTPRARRNADAGIPPRPVAPRKPVDLYQLGFWCTVAVLLALGVLGLFLTDIVPGVG